MRFANEVFKRILVDKNLSMYDKIRADIYCTGECFMYYYRRLRDMREDHDLLQKQVAEILNITREQYQLYESGKREIKAYQLIILADHYNVSVDYLLGRTDNSEMNI